MSTVADNERRTLQTSADGVFMYEAACLEEAELVNHRDYWGYIRRVLI